MEELSAKHEGWTPPDPIQFRDSIEMEGQRLDYLVTTEFLPTYDDCGKVNAWWYCTSYSKPGEDPAGRPVTFAFNGGPGSASMYLHIGALGPKILLPGDDLGLTMPRPPYQLQDNANTLLDLTDLVFIDPVGTGFSRAPDWEKAKAFWGVQQDIDSVAEFIRVWLTRKNRWESPLFVVGESYGGVRGGGLMAKLQDLGVMPLGFIAVSPALTYLGLNSSPMNDHQFIHTLPPMAATAWYHKKLDQDLLELSVREITEMAHQWATTEYLTMLWRGENRLSADEYEHCVMELHRFTGLDPDDIRQMRLRIPYRKFATMLLKDRRCWTSIYDSRLTTPGQTLDYNEDPHIFQLACAYTSAFFAYFRQRGAAMPEERSYLVSNRDIGPNWDHASGYDCLPGEKPGRGGGYTSTVESLAKAMRRCPFLKVFVGAGYFDIHCSAEAGAYGLDHMDIPRELLENNIIRKMYFGGHMYYSNPQEHRRFKTDMIDFYGAALEGRPVE